MPSIDRELKALVEKLNARGIPHALCGGLAMAVHGFPRATLDIDLVALLGSAADIEKTARELGFTLRAAPMNFADGRVTITRISKTSPQNEDVLPLDILTFDASIETGVETEEIEWNGVKLRVVSRKDLIKLKQLRNNQQDQADIEKLAS
jgi:hypothetical protein